MADYKSILLELEEIRARVEQLVTVVSQLQQAETSAAAATGETTAAAATAASTAAGTIPADEPKAFPPLVVEGVEEIFGGRPTKDFPDCCAVGGNEFHGYFCTGTLIAANLVVTAKHCHTPEQPVTRVFLKGHDTSKKGEEIAVIATHAHPEADLMVLVLERDSKVNPRHVAQDAEVKAKQGLVVGFGTTDVQGETGYGIKRKATVPIMTLNCGTDEDQVNFRCKKNIELVAGHKGIRRDTCRGDSGGPLYIESAEGGYHLLGVTSRGLKDFDHFPPQRCGNGGIYVRADQFLGWIRDVTGISIAGALP
jgi:hypothetical protein